MIVSSFLTGLAKALHLNARYDDAWAASGRALAEAEDAGLDFALGRITTTQAQAAIGRGRFREARSLLDAVADDAFGDPHFGANIAILRAQIELANHRAGRAVTELSRAPTAPDTGTRGEMEAYLALAAALAGQSERAAAHAKRAVATTETIEARVVVALTRAVIARGTRPRRSSLVAALAEAHVSGVLDPVVVALRASPELALEARRLVDELAEREPWAATSRDVYWKWIDSFDAGNGVATLSRREREILQLVVEGNGNREIAARLFISVATVKVHLRHIYEKLGAKNRAEAAARAADYAASSAASRDSSVD